jgi:hypothetical protein
MSHNLEIAAQVRHQRRMYSSSNSSISRRSAGDSWLNILSNRQLSIASRDIVRPSLIRSNSARRDSVILRSLTRHQ